MASTAQQKEEEASFEVEDRDQPIPPEHVVAYNELRSCADLFRMHATGKLELQPDFQREVVWKRDEQTRFIDSLVKQLPIPSMCFSLDVKSQRWKVIDGLQRMQTITSFLGTAEWQLGDVLDIHPALKGKKNVALRAGSEEEKRLYASVEDISVPITVIRCDYEKPSHMRYLFTIFNRLNSGGVRLNNQEIRNCIYSGSFNTLLKEFDKGDPHWRRVKQFVWGKMDRFRSVEILLRALAFSENLQSYDGNLAGFLNDYMHRNRALTDERMARMNATLTFMAKGATTIKNEIPGGKRSLTFWEGVFVGLISNETELRQRDDDADLRQKGRTFLQSPFFSEGARYALSSVQTVTERLQAAKQIFAA